MNNFINYLPSLWFDKNNLLLIDNWKELINILDSKSKKIISIDGDYSISWNKIKKKLDTSINKNKKVIYLNFYECIYSHKTLNLYYKNNLSDHDTLFGKVTKNNIEKLLNIKKVNIFINKFKKILLKKNNYDFIILLGTGINSIYISKDFDSKLYINLTKTNALISSKWESKGKTQTVSPNFFYYYIFPIMERYQKKKFSKIDYYVDNNHNDKYLILPILDLYKILKKVSQEPLKLNPIYEPGVWGGKWLVNKRKLQINNCAIGMELIGQEQNILIQLEKKIIEIPFTLIMSVVGNNILGKKNFKKYKNYFPVRVAYDDTFNNQGENLSIQVHPNKSYMLKNFNEPLGQAEIYYIADKLEKSKVYIGFNNNISINEFKKQMQYSHNTGNKINFEKYINSIDSKIGDLFLIPPGTIHAAGSDNFVLEISNTPYRYTFKIYDYCRKNLDGKKRKLSQKHAFNVLKYQRNSNWVNKNLRPQPKLIKQNKQLKEYLLSNHKSFTFNLNRVHFHNQYEDSTIKNMHILNLVKGRSVYIESEKNSKIKIGLSETILIPKVFGKYKIKSLNKTEHQIIKVILR